MNLVKYTLSILFCLILFSVPTLGQIVRNGQTYYGNEWINYEQQYIKIKVGADGIYQLTPEQLTAAGFPVSNIDASEYRLYWLGTEQRLHCTKTDGALSDGDFLAFYGEKNRSQLDRYLFSDPDRQMLNPDYGLTSDTSVYFLTWTPGAPAQSRYEIVENDPNNSFNKVDWYLHHEKLILHNVLGIK